VGTGTATFMSLFASILVLVNSSYIYAGINACGRGRSFAIVSNLMKATKTDFQMGLNT